MHYYVAVEDVKKEIKSNARKVDMLLKDMPLQVELEKQKTGYGEKVFLKCPQCGKRRTELYLDYDVLSCRKCYSKNIYAGIQNHCVGGCQYIGYRMRRYAISHNIDIVKFPFRYFDYNKPSNRKTQSWLDDITVLQALENMRMQAHFYSKRWSSKTVNSVLTWNNSMMYTNDLGDMVDYIIEWDKGVDMNLEWIK